MNYKDLFTKDYFYLPTYLPSTVLLESASSKRNSGGVRARIQFGKESGHVEESDQAGKVRKESIGIRLNDQNVKGLEIIAGTLNQGHGTSGRGRRQDFNGQGSHNLFGRNEAGQHANQIQRDTCMNAPPKHRRRLECRCGFSQQSSGQSSIRPCPKNAEKRQGYGNSGQQKIG